MIDEITYTGLTVDISLTGYTCSGMTFPIETVRTEKGWTLEFVFNRDNLPWISGGTFYYFGVTGNDDPKIYADNNLSFGFTEDGRIKWSAIHYSGWCQTNSGYTESYYITSGQTEPLCTTGITKDFAVSIVFDRKYRFTDCDVENEGGINDMITGMTLVNSALDVMSGATADYLIVETLNKKWYNERHNRLGTLKIYLNGSPIYKLEDWEEVIPSFRTFDSLEQIFGMGTPLMGGIHDGVCCFIIKSAKYYIQPLDFVHIKYNFELLLNIFDIFICGSPCEDDLIGYTSDRTFLVDLGLRQYTTISPWNNLDGSGGIPNGTRIYNLIDTTSRASNLSIGVTSNYWGVSLSAPITGQTYPETATRDSFAIIGPRTGSISIGKCDYNKKYDISILSSKKINGAVSNFTIGGITKSINSTNNVTLLQWQNISPVAGAINITAYQPIAGVFATINVIVIKETFGLSCGEDENGDIITEDDILISSEDGDIITS